MRRACNGQHLQAEADLWSFILWQTGDPDFQPKH